MSINISDIEGIGPAMSEKLRAAKIETVEDLLKHGATPKGRAQIADASGVDEKRILKWVNMADLYRIKGIGSEYSELLEASGVDTVKELRNRKPDNLYQKMVEVNGKQSQEEGRQGKLSENDIVHIWFGFLVFILLIDNVQDIVH